MEWFLKVVRDNYSNFNGRARRKEYWMFVLFNLIFAVIAATLDNMLGLTFNEMIPYGYLYIAYAFAVLIPGIAVAVRRLHDVNKSGWMMLVVFIPFVGAIWLLVLLVIEGTKGDNQYGADPKGSEFNEIGNN